MINNALRPGFYSRVNQTLQRMATRDHDELVDDWQDEASQAAINNRPEKTRYIEHMINRILYRNRN